MPQFPSKHPDWPKFSDTGQAYPRKEAADSLLIENQYLSRLIGRLPASADDDADGLAYQELLDRVLEDRIVTEDEADALQETASSWGLSQENVTEIHHSYLRDLVSLALEDGIVTERESNDLRVVATALNIDHRVVEKLLEEGRLDPPSGTSEPTPSRVAEFSGKSVCFTGAAQCSIDGEPITRDQALALADDLGMEARQSVTKTLDLLVLADPQSMSGKAKKARQYGIRLMAEDVFWRRSGVKID